ncbi:MAG: Sensory box histidine kinase/response regulator [Parcubacteria bacterium C7867-001]|nr:MAG: Sensory box histidine kinase/response regulator [Parcubacteria bacterium C7867-001]
MPPTKAKKPSFLLVAGTLIFVLGIATSSIVYQSTMKQNRSHVLHAAHVVALNVTPSDIVLLTGSSTDVTTSVYQRTKKHLMQMHDTVSQMRFAYVLGKNSAGEVFFYADSEDPSSEDYSPPGQVYDEASPLLHAMFTDGTERIEGPITDRWGTWVSAYEQIHASDGTVIGVVGVDLPAEKHLTTLIAYTAVPLLVAIVFIALLIFVRRAQRADAAFQ